MIGMDGAAIAFKSIGSRYATPHRKSPHKLCCWLYIIMYYRREGCHLSRLSYPSSLYIFTSILATRAEQLCQPKCIHMACVRDMWEWRVRLNNASNLSAPVSKWVTRCAHREVNRSNLWRCLIYIALEYGFPFNPLIDSRSKATYEYITIIWFTIFSYIPIKHVQYTSYTITSKIHMLSFGITIGFTEDPFVLWMQILVFVRSNFILFD